MQTNGAVFLHKPASELTTEQTSLLAEINAHAETTRDLLAKVHASAGTQIDTDNTTEAESPAYWARYAEGMFRTSYMQLRRAVAHSGSF